MPEAPATTTEIVPILSLDDARVVSMLNAEHSSLIANRTLAYNEAFSRGGMFLTFLSMSFVGLALLGQGIGFSEDFLVVAAIVLAFDLVVGLTTYGRIVGANNDDLRAIHGMARLRQAYIRVAPVMVPFLTSPVNDDIDSLVRVYGDPPGGSVTVIYALTTSGGMIGLITSMVGGVLAAVVALVLGVTSDLGVVLLGIVGTVVVFAALVGATLRYVPGAQRRLGVAFPAEPEMRA